MAELWPRNIIPYDERKVKALGSVERVALYLAAIDAPLSEAELSARDGAHAHALIEAGLLRREGATIVPTRRHSRDPHASVPGQLDHKRAKVQFALQVVRDADAALDARGAQAQAGIGVITLPDTPETLAVATGILAEAEDQLRALAETAEPADGHKVRMMIFIGSTPS